MRVRQLGGKPVSWVAAGREAGELGGSRQGPIAGKAAAAVFCCQLSSAAESVEPALRPRPLRGRDLSTVSTEPQKPAASRAAPAFPRRALPAAPQRLPCLLPPSGFPPSCENYICKAGFHICNMLIYICTTLYYICNIRP